MSPLKKYYRMITSAIPKKNSILLFRFVSFFFFLYLGFLFVRSAENYAITQRSKLFLLHTKIIAASLNIDNVKKLKDPDSSEKQKIYSEIEEQLSRMVKAYPKLKYIYIMGQQGQDIISLVENLETDPQQLSSKPGDVYSEASDAFRSLFKDGDGLVEGPLSDRWGTWYSALVPLLDPQTKQRIAVFGIDLDSLAWKRELQPVTWLALGTAILFFGGLFILLNLLTYQRELIRRLTANEERFRQVADNSHDWVWETDPNGFFTYSSRAVRTILGYEIEDMIGKKYFYELCSLDDRQRLTLEVKRVLEESDLVFHETVKMMHKNKKEMILEVRGFARLDQDGQLAGWRGIARDITKIKQQEKKIMSLAKFPLENPNQVLRIAQDGTLLYANTACKNLLKHWDIKVGERVPKDWLRMIEDSLGSHHPLEMKMPLVNQTFLFIFTPVTEAEYVNIYGLDITVRDRMERELVESKHALEVANRDLAENEKTLRVMLKDLESKNDQLNDTQDELIQTQKMAAVGMISSGIAHEIKNPLAIILQGTERIEKIMGGQVSQGKEYVDMIKNAATRANKVVGTLLNFARATHIELKPLNIQNVIDTAVSLISQEAVKNHIEISRQYNHGNVLVLGDNIALEQVFFDLFVNAFDAMPPEGGRIHITTKVSGSEGKQKDKPVLIVEISDTGCGIPEENIPMLFVPFFTTKDVGKGTGLGLSTVYLILERHHAKIEVKSKEKEGTTFIIQLSVSREHK